MEETPSTQDNKPKYKRKRPKSVLMNARKYGKQGKFGRGSHLDEDVYQYFVRVLELLKAGFDSDEEKQCLINNAFEEIKGNEVYYSYNQIGCRVIENLLPYAQPETLEHVMTSISDDLRKISCDRFASYVLQKLVAVSADRSTSKLIEDLKTKYPEEHIEKCNAFTVKISKYLLNNMEDFVWDNFANRIIRQCIMSLAGMEPKDNKEKSRYSKESYNFREVPTDWNEIVEDYVQRLLKWPQLNEFPYSELTSGLLQILIAALKSKQPKLQKKLIKYLATESFNKNENESSTSGKSYPSVFNSEPATRLIEAILNTASDKMYNLIFQKCFASYLRPLSLMRSSNFAIQNLLNNCNDKEIFETIFDEIADSFKDILSSGHTGILVSMTKACRRLCTQQARLVKVFSNMLDCVDDASSYKFVPLTIQLLPKERAEKTESFVINIHGSIIIQEMLHFNKPIKIVNSLMAMNPADLLSLFCDPKGSHIADAFFQSQYIGEKSREKMCRILKGMFTDLAMSKYGSRALEHIWEKSNKVQQIKIMSELVQKVGLLMGSDIGRIIGIKYNVELYKRSPTDWEQNIQKQDNIKNMFNDIITK